MGGMRLSVRRIFWSNVTWGLFSFSMLTWLACDGDIGSVGL